MTAISKIPPVVHNLIAQRHEDGHPRFITDFTGDVALSRDIFGNQNIARLQAPYRAVSDLDVHRAREGEDADASGSIVPVVAASGIEAADDNPALFVQHGLIRQIAQGLQLRFEILEVGLAIGSGYDAYDCHEHSFRPGSAALWD